MDLAGVGHWDDVYVRAADRPAPWTPEDHASRTLENVLHAEIRRSGARSVLEVGAGNSVWLPHLARTLGVEVAGVDYSEVGARLARERLAAAGIPGRISCADIFAVGPEELGRHDFVFSLGLVEHFTELEGVLARLAAFVKPGGVLFTEVPNLRSIHGVLSFIWQPELLAKHRVLSRARLVRAYRALGLEDVRGSYAGLASLDIVAWESHARWPRLVPVVVPWVRRAQRRLDALLRGTRSFRGIAPLAPFVCVTGRWPAP